MKRSLWRKLILILFVLCASLSISQSGALAQPTFPARPVTIWIGNPAGGGTDIITRGLAEASEKGLGDKFVAINKPGAVGGVAASLLTKEKPDGYTLASFTDTPVLKSPHLLDISFDPLKDLTYLFRIGFLKVVFVVRADSPFKNWGELVNWARTNPGQLVFGHPGVGSTLHIAMAKIALTEKFTFKSVPFAGEAASVSALLGGHIMVSSGNSVGWRSHVEAKAVRILLVGEKEGVDYAPEAATFEKMGYDFETPTSLIICGPPGMPDPIRERLEKAFIEGSKAEAFVALAKNNELMLTEPCTGKNLYDYIKKWNGLFEQYIKEAGLYKAQSK